MKRTFQYIFKLLPVTLLSLAASVLPAQDLTGVKIHINPGHGGWDSDDRGIRTPLYPVVGPNQGFWESQSNLDKGLQLREMLEALGATVQMSRTLNRTQDDLPLSQIVRMANEFQADFMLSIHSNAGNGVANYVLQLFAGKSDGDTHTYPTPTPKSDESKAISTEIAKNLVKNKITHWTTSSYNVSGDKTFARVIMGWPNGYGVLRGLIVPGVISEGSMHDYIPENYRLMNMDYKWLEAWNFKKAFCTYFKNAEIPTGNIAGYVKDNRLKLQDGNYTKYGKDFLLPINGAKVTLVETGAEYTVDNNRNGVYVFKDVAPGTYSVKVEADGYYSRTEQITVEKNEINYLNFELNRMRNTPPQVVNYSPKVAPTDSVIASSEIVLEFNWDMDEESTRAAFSITPAIEGTLTFEDSNYRLVFKPNMPMEKSTLYTVKLDKSAKHPDNLSMTEDFVFQFTTTSRNRLSVVNSYPVAGYKRIYAGNPVFFLLFDRKIDSESVRSGVKILDAENHEINKSVRSIALNKVSAPYGDMSFELEKPLVAGNNYKLLIEGKVMDEQGIKVIEPIEIPFTASSVLVTDKPVFEDFDAADKYSFDAGQSLNVTNVSIQKNTGTKLFGKASCRLKAKFNEASAKAVYKLNQPIATGNDHKVFGLHVYGDMSGNELQLQFRSAAGENVEEVYLPLCRLNFKGWEFVEVKLEKEGNFLFSGICLEHQDGPLSKSTNIFIDNLLQYPFPTGLLSKEMEKAISIYPNPATEIIHVKTEEYFLPVLQLYSLNGVLLKTTNDRQMSVSEFTAGTYLLKVKTTKGTFNRIVMIK